MGNPKEPHIKRKIAHIEKLLQELREEISALTDQHQTGSILHQIEQQSRGEIATLHLTPGKTALIPPSEEREIKLPYLHWCAVCFDIFRSRIENPPRCGKCKSQYWRGDFVKDVRRPQSKTK